MEQLDINGVTEIWMYLDTNALHSLGRVSSSISNNIRNIESTQYTWRIKLETLIGINLLSLHSNNWRDICEFIFMLWSHGNRNLIFSRDLVSAKIGLLLGLDPSDSHAYQNIINYANVDTIQLLYPYFNDNQKSASIFNAILEDRGNVVSKLLELGATPIPQDFIFFPNREIFEITRDLFPQNLEGLESWELACKEYYEMIVDNPTNVEQATLAEISLGIIAGELDMDAFRDIDYITQQGMTWLAINNRQFDLARHMHYIIVHENNTIFDEYRDVIADLVCTGVVTLYSQIDFLYAEQGSVNSLVSELLTKLGKLSSERAAQFIQQLLLHVYATDTVTYIRELMVKAGSIGNYHAYKVLLRYLDLLRLE